MTIPVSKGYDIKDAPSFEAQQAAKAQWDLVRNDPNVSADVKSTAQQAYAATTETCMQELGMI